MATQGHPDLALEPSLPCAWSLLGRASVEGDWTGAVAGVVTAWTLLGLMPDDGLEGVSGILILGTPFAAASGAVVGSVVALVLMTALLALPTTPRSRVAGSWATAPVLAVLVGALSIGFSSWNTTSDPPMDLAAMLALTGWSVLAVLWRGRIVLRLLRRPAPGTRGSRRG